MNKLKKPVDNPVNQEIKSVDKKERKKSNIKERKNNKHLTCKGKEKETGYIYFVDSTLSCQAI